jgi:hypothetical protein
VHKYITGSELYGIDPLASGAYNPQIQKSAFSETKRGKAGQRAKRNVEKFWKLAKKNGVRRVFEHRFYLDLSHPLK